MAKKLWGGRFAKKTDPLVEEFTKSIDYDCKLAKYDVEGSIIHVDILKKTGVLTNKEAKKLHQALNEIYGHIKKGKFKIDKKSEDIHTHIQNLVEKKVGGLALKLHTARSRNEEVIFDLKLFCKFELLETESLSAFLRTSLLKVCKKVQGVIIPGYTHLQHAHLVFLSDYLKIFVEMLARDINRMQYIRENIQLALGAGALAGTPVPSKVYNQKIKEFIKGRKIGKTPKSMVNSLDAVSDRDFVIEALSMLSILGMHLSRLAEDLIIWSTKEFNFVDIDDSFATGSSLMPQKKNPDVLELVRGYTGRLYGNLVSVLAMMKGLPLTYNRDMQLDKEPLFNSFDIVRKMLKVLARFIETLKWNREVIKKKIEEDETFYATDLIYCLVKKEIPFKKAHDIIGKLVKYSLDSGRKIKDMKDQELERFSIKLKHKEIVRLMDPLVSVKSRVSIARTKSYAPF